MLLNGIIPELESVVTRNDVIIFWSYKAPPVEQQHHQFGGMVVIPKQTPKKKEE